MNPHLSFRFAEESDIAELLVLEQKFWDFELRTEEKVIYDRIKFHHNNQFIALFKGKICGVLYTQLIKDKTLINYSNFKSQEQLADPTGSVLQLLSITVEASIKGFFCYNEFYIVFTSVDIAAYLREYVFKYDRKITEVIAMSRCSKFPSYNSLKDEDLFLEYESYVLSGEDPTIYFHMSGGAKVEKIIRSYREEDRKNLGCAILISYDLKKLLFDKEQLKLCENLALKICEDIITIRTNDVNDLPLEVWQLLNSPLMNNLDSLQMMILRNKIEERVEEKLLPTFLFEFPTPQLIETHFRRRVLEDHKYISKNENFNAKFGNEVINDKYSSPIAIVGTSFKLPNGIDDWDSLFDIQFSKGNTRSEWDCQHNRNAKTIEEIIEFLHDSKGEMNAEDIFNRIRYGNFLNKDQLVFDNKRFNIWQAEAESMEMTQQLLLSVTYDACLDAKMPFLDSRYESRDNNVGVFVGTFGLVDPLFSKNDLMNNNNRSSKTSVFDATTKSISFCAGRISQLFNLEGPSFVVDSACSSSLVALHNAKNSLRSGECNTAIVSAVNFMSSPDFSIHYAKAGMLSYDGICHTFDDNANGYSRGEGCISFVLKRLNDALRDGDKVYAVLKGSAVMSNGKSASLIAPNLQSQVKLYKKALYDANIQAVDVVSIESHGTGTKLGDSIEVQSLSTVYGGVSERKKPLLISSVKGNIGHLEHASGLAGILSAILSLNTKMVMPNAQLNSINKTFPVSNDSNKIYFPTETEELIGREDSSPLIIGISSFGFSGTIGHVLLESFHSNSINTNVLNLKEKKKNSKIGVSKSDDHLKFIWQFPGQGVVSLNAFKDLFFNCEPFKQSMSYCNDIMKLKCGLGVIDLLYPNESDPEAVLQATNNLLETRYSQVVLICIQYSLVEVLKSNGISPWAVTGHSLGEYSAAVVAGVISIEDCINLVCERGNIIMNEDKCVGSMVAVRANVDTVLKAIGTAEKNNLVSIAAVNGHNNVVLSGETQAVQDVLQALIDIPSKYLDVQHGFHSPSMNFVIDSFAKVLDSYSFQNPKVVHYFSSLLGEQIKEQISTKSYWLSHLLNTVQFEKTIKSIFSLQMESDNYCFIEIGPKDILTKLCKQLVNISSTTDFTNKIQFSSFDHYYQRMMLPLHIPHPPKYTQTEEILPIINNETDSNYDQLDDSKSAIIGIVSSLTNLKKHEICHSDSFLSMGFDSLNITELCGQIASSFDLKITTTELLANGNVDKLSHFILKRINSTNKKSVANKSNTEQNIALVTQINVNDNLLLEQKREYIQIYYDLLGDSKFLLDHVIRGKAIFPASGHIYSMWQTIGLSNDIELNNFQILKEVAISQNKNELSFKVKYNKEKEYIEVYYDDELVSHSTIKVLSSPLKLINVPKIEKKKYDDCDLLESNDFYNNFNRYNYNYGPNFKLIDFQLLDESITMLKPSVAYNWINYLDSFLQIAILNPTLLRLPTGVKSLKLKHSDIFPLAIQLTGKDSSNTVRSDIALIQEPLFTIARSITEKKSEINIVTFVPYDHNLSVDREIIEYKSFYIKFCISQLNKLLVDKKNTENYPHLNNLAKHFININETEDSNTFANFDEFPGFSIAKDIFCDPNLLKTPIKILSNHHNYPNLFRSDILFSSIRTDAIRICVDIINENLIFKYIFLEISTSNSKTNVRVQTLIHYNIECYLSLAVKIDNEKVEVMRNMNGEELSEWIINGPIPIENKCDVIYLSHCIHFAADIVKSLSSVCEALNESGFIILEEYISELPLYICGLDPIIWNTATDERDHGLWLSHERWKSVFETVNLDLIISFSNGDCNVYLLRKRFSNYKNTDNKIVSMKTVLEGLKSGEEHQFNVASENTIIFGTDGVLGFVKSLNRELKISENIQGFLFLDGENGDKFSYNHQDFYRCQKRLLTNVIWNSKHGSFREMSHQTIIKSASNWTIHIERAGNLNSFYYKESKTASVKVAYAGLNFKDVMLSYDRLRLDDQVIRLGLEFSGIYNESAVMGIGINCFSNQVDPNENCIWKIPSTISLIEAASIPIVYATVLYCLDYCARIKSNQSILIHSGAGGVGQAAINICLQRGCKVFTTCSDGKRSFLREKFNMSDDQIGNSHDDSFKDWIMRVTNNCGVDVVINSLAGEKLLSSIQCLARFGNFCEIGKYDIMNDSRVGLKLFQNNISFHCVDISDMIHDKKFSKILSHLVQAGLDNGEIKPIHIDRVFDHTDLKDAIRYMGSGNHIGKIIINMISDPPSLNKIKIRPTFMTHGKHIITGGLGGFGLELSEWLIRSGAEKVILLSRSGVVKNGYQKRKLNFYHQLQVVQCNVVNERDVEAFLKNNKDIIGIWHLAMQLYDTLFSKMSKDQWDVCVNTKIVAANNLDKYSRKYSKDLKNFVMFSSVNSLYGNAGQTNYSYGNACMEILGLKRKDDELPATVICWGRIGNVGYLSKRIHAVTEERLADQHIDSCLDDLHTILNLNKTIIACYKEKDNINDTDKADAKNTNSIKTTIKAKYDENELRELIINTLVHLMNISRKDISYSQPIVEMGLDSLSSTEFISQISMALGINVKLSLVAENYSIQSIVLYLINILPSVHNNNNNQLNETKTNDNSKLFGKIRKEIFEIKDLFSKNINIRLNDFDSQLFDFRVGIVELDISYYNYTLLNNQWNTLDGTIKELLSQQNMKVAYLYQPFVDISHLQLTFNEATSLLTDDNNNHTKTPWPLVDQKVIYITSVESLLKKESSNSQASVRLLALDEGISKELLDLVYLSGINSRYNNKVDSNFSKDNFHSMYDCWLRNSLNRSIADEIFVIRDNNSNIDVGFATVKKVVNSGKVKFIGGLLAVSESIPNRMQIALSLFDRMYQWIIETTEDLENITFELSTQGHNQNAVNFYESLMFRVKSIQNIYHIWRKD